MNTPDTWSQPLLRALSIAAVIVLVAAVYYPGLSGSFIFDDMSNIVENPAVQMSYPSPESVAEAATAYGSRPPHRPVSTISLALDHWLWDGEPFGFKLTNLILHLIATVLIFLLARQLFRRGTDLPDSSAPFWVAVAIATVWAMHPLQVSTVFYVVQRMEMLAALFIVLSLLAYLGGRSRLEAAEPGGWPLVGLSGFCVLLALLSKETGALAPFFMLAMELLVFRFAAASVRTTRVLKIGFGAVVMMGLVVYLFWLVPEFIYGDHFVKREFTWDERLLTQLRVLPMYTAWILFPSIDQYLFYYDHFTHSESLLNPITTLLGGLFLLALLIVAWLLKRRAPLVALGVVWFFIAHALTSNLFPLELVFEHRNYFASFAVLLALAAAMLELGALRNRRHLSAAVFAALVVTLGVLTAIRSATWGDPLNLALHHVDLNPQSERAGLDMAELYLGNESWSPEGSLFVPAARKQLERVAKLPTAGTTADQALIVLAEQSDEPTPPAAWERLLQKVRTRTLDADDYDAIYNLVQQRYRGLQISDRRLWQLHAALCQRSDIPPQIHARFGYYAALVLEDKRRATSAFRRALQLLSEDRSGGQALKLALENAGIELVEGVEACQETGR